MPFDLKAGSFLNLDQLDIRDTDIDIHNTVALHTCEMVMMIVPASPVSMAPIGKFDPIQQPYINEHLDCPENSGAIPAASTISDRTPVPIQNNLFFTIVSFLFEFICPNVSQLLALCP
jgi:hypothetical protein